MAVTSSGIYYTTFEAVLGSSQLALDFEGNSMKLALYNNSITPNFQTDTNQTAAPYTTNQVTGGAWVTGGAALVSPTISNNSGVLKWVANDIVASGTSITNARCGLIYYTAGSQQCIALIDFTNDYSTVSGTFSIIWAAGGIFSIGLTPTP